MAAVPSATDVPTLLTAHRAALERLANDEDARKVLPGPGGRGDGETLAADLSALQLAEALRDAADRRDVPRTRDVLARRTENIAWLSTPHRPWLARAVEASRAAIAAPEPLPADDRLSLQWQLETTRAHAEAERAAQHAFEAWVQRRSLARLCGTWQWTIHNHRHHQDHKTMLVFPTPEARAGGPRLTRTVVLGDTVFLRWEFPGGYQEESLLFTGEGQRLEGTFVNSTGAWGAITGKRTAACKSDRP